MTPLESQYDVSDAFRRERLLGDRQEMERIRCEMLDWSTDGQSPVRYVVTYKLASLLDPRTLRDSHRVLFELGTGYPGRPPIVAMLDSPPVFHPNVFDNGRICIGPMWWTPEEGLGSLVIRVAKMLLYFPDVTSAASAANPSAAYWYRLNKSSLPLDRNIIFPDPIAGGCAERPRLIVRRRRPE
jgi:ubiquitin-protein ligase